MTVVCRNPECSENGIEKGMAPGGTPPPADIVISCGVCGEECERSDQDDDELEPLPA